jgi:hypothetical protein
MSTNCFREIIQMMLLVLNQCLIFVLMFSYDLSTEWKVYILKSLNIHIFIKLDNCLELEVVADTSVSNLLSEIIAA